MPKNQTKKYYGLQVHTLTFLKVDESGESIDGKQYEYTGDHSSFCDGIQDEYLEEVKMISKIGDMLKGAGFDGDNVMIQGGSAKKSN